MLINTSIYYKLDLQKHISYNKQAKQIIKNLPRPAPHNHLKKQNTLHNWNKH